MMKLQLTKLELDTMKTNGVERRSQTKRENPNSLMLEWCNKGYDPKQKTCGSNRLASSLQAAHTGGSNHQESSLQAAHTGGSNHQESSLQADHTGGSNYQESNLQTTHTGWSNRSILLLMFIMLCNVQQTAACDLFVEGLLDILDLAGILGDSLKDVYAGEWTNVPKKSRIKNPNHCKPCNECNGKGYTGVSCGGKIKQHQICEQCDGTGVKDLKDYERKLLKDLGFEVGPKTWPKPTFIQWLFDPLADVIIDKKWKAIMKKWEATKPKRTMCTRKRRSPKETGPFPDGTRRVTSGAWTTTKHPYPEEGKRVYIHGPGKDWGKPDKEWYIEFLDKNGGQLNPRRLEYVSGNELVPLGVLQEWVHNKWMPAHQAEAKRRLVAAQKLATALFWSNQAVGTDV